MKKEAISLPDADLDYFPNFLSRKKADHLYNFLIDSHYWRQDKIKLFGKEVLQPRLTALFGENENTYKYSGLKMFPIPFPDLLKSIKKECEEKSNGAKFNICLANLYRDGNDSMGWHADDEKELGLNPVIASLSLGADRWFHLRHKKLQNTKHKIKLQHGSLLIMKGTTQQFWKHQLPKTKKVISPRINLTFRNVS